MGSLFKPHDDDGRTGESPSEKEPLCKWWEPRTNGQKELFENTKKDLQVVLTIYQDGIHVYDICRKVYAAASSEIEFTKMGFKTLGEFLFHCDDILEVRARPGGRYMLFLRGGGNEKTAHIRDLVRQQKALSNPALEPYDLTKPVSSDVLVKIFSPQPKVVERSQPKRQYKTRGVYVPPGRKATLPRDTIQNPGCKSNPPVDSIRAADVPHIPLRKTIQVARLPLDGWTLTSADLAAGDLLCSAEYPMLVLHK